ncbi:uncharacterized protein LOC143833877 isoform X2 [Paroedura picta]|uniref:uncharacterized protein LOC143833877 isoform X2 n=1 Tax=Paroedura picta TaxID=143630 RepID=UPI004057BAB0
MAAAQGTTTVQESPNQGNPIKMEEEESAGSRPEEEMEEADALTTERTGERQPEEEPTQKWDAQLQEFLKTLQGPGSRRGGPRLPEQRTSPGPSDGLTEPGALGASQPLPNPTGEAKQNQEAMRCGRAKKRVRTLETIRAGMWQWRFRTLSYQEAEGPRETCRQLQELCCQWLRPKRHSKEQILDLLALEQFLIVLPPEMQRWVSENNPEDCAQAVSLAEEFLKAQQGAKERAPQGSSEDLFVNPPETCKELPGAAKGPCFSEARQCVDGSTNFSGDEWLSETEEDLKPFLEIPEEEEPQEMLPEAAKENHSPCGRKGDENSSRAQSPDGKNHETETAGPVLSAATDPILSEATALPRVNSMQSSATKESPSPHLLPCEPSQTGGKTYTCWHCGQNFWSSSELLSHERNHVGEKLYKCAHCGESERIYIGQKPHKCPHCGNTFGGDLPEGFHAAETPYKGLAEGENIRSVSGLKTYQRDPRAEKPYRCAQCGESFHKKSGLKRHERIHCALFSYCGESVGQNPGLVEHGQPPLAEAFVCFACGKAFSVSAELAAHIQTHKEKPLDCAVCGRKFRTSLLLTEHQKGHTAGKQHKCLVCGKNFKCLKYLKSHAKTHSGETPYKCSFCEKRFRRNYGLMLHERIHTGEKPYRCSDCGETFPKRSDFLAHVKKSHAGQKAYRCCHCGESCCSSHDLLRHQKIHTGEEPGTCSQSGRTFLQWSDPTDQAGEKGSECSECLRIRSLSSSRAAQGRKRVQEKPFEREQTHAAKTAVAKKEQRSNAGVLAGDGWLSETEEELMSFLESPEVEQPQEMPSDTAEENDSPCGRKGHENGDRTENQTEYNHEMEGLEPVLSERLDRGLREDTASHEVNSMKREGHEGNHGPSPRLSTCERSHVGKNTYKCWRCGQSFGSSSHLGFHEKSHMGERPHQCVHCGESKKEKPHKCSRSVNIFGGNSQEGTRITQNPYKCDVCGDHFKNDHGLRIHQAVHRGKKDYKCSFCGKSFRWRSLLVAHERIHTGGKPCRGADFGSNFGRNLQEGTHTTEKSDRCAVCGNHFKNDLGLRIHQRVHKGKKRYRCSYCGKGFHQHSLLVGHERVHTGEKPSCSNSGKIFAGDSQERTHTTEKYTYRCAVCGDHFKNDLGLRIHQRIHMGKKQHRCSYCSKSFRRHTVLVVHERIHMGERPYRAPQFGSTFAGNSREGIHTLEDPYKCLACGNNFKNSHGLKIHQRVHRGKKEYKCSSCGKSFRWPSLLVAHERIHTGEKPYRGSGFGSNFGRNSQEGTHATGKPYRCAVCGDHFKNDHGLRIHQRVHKGKTQYRCSYCGKGFRWRSLMVIHERIHTREKPYASSDFGNTFKGNSRLGIHPTRKPYQCTVCGDNFKNDHGLRIHQRVHRGKKQYKCSYCNKIFHWRSLLVAHERIHTGEKPSRGSGLQNDLGGNPQEGISPLEKPYKCDLCGDGFKNDHGLKVHQAVHRGKKQYKCSYCGKSFRWRSLLEAHVRIHTQEEPYRCSDFENTFGGNSQEGTHTTEKPYRCAVCGNIFKNDHGLRIHQRVHKGKKQYK